MRKATLTLCTILCAVMSFGQNTLTISSPQILNFGFETKSRTIIQGQDTSIIKIQYPLFEPCQSTGMGCVEFMPVALGDMHAGNVNLDSLIQIKTKAFRKEHNTKASYTLVSLKFTGNYLSEMKTQSFGKKSIPPMISSGLSMMHYSKTERWRNYNFHLLHRQSNKIYMIYMY